MPIPPHPFAERIATAAQWLDLLHPAITYDPEDVAGGPLLTDELVAWLQDAGRGVMAWVQSGTPEGCTVEAAQADHRTWRQEQRFLKVLEGFGPRALGFIREAMVKGARPEVSMEAALEECQQAIEAHRAAKAP